MTVHAFPTNPRAAYNAAHSAAIRAAERQAFPVEWRQPVPRLTNRQIGNAAMVVIGWTALMGLGIWLMSDAGQVFLSQIWRV